MKCIGDLKYEAAFFDVDWTLFDHASGRFVPSGIEAVKRLAKQGTKVFLCSARNYESIRTFGLFRLGIPWSGYVSHAGGVARVGNHYVLKQTVDPKIIKKLCKTATDLGRNLEIVTIKSRFMISNPDEYTRDYYQVFKDPLPKVKPYRNENCVGVLFFGPEEYDEEIKRLNPGLTYFRFAPLGMDIQVVPHIKGEGIKAILDYVGIDKRKAIGFGDDLQDISMASSCGTFVCMGNGKDEVKKHATFVTKRIEDDGLSYALNTLGAFSE